MTKTTKVLGGLAYTICIAVMVWIIISFIDVMAHNMTTYHYVGWNFFSLLVKVSDAIQAM